MILIVFLFSACLALSLDFCGPSRRPYKVSYLGVHQFILFHKSIYIFFARSILFLHGASFSVFFGLASSTPSLFVLFLIVFCLLCKPVDLDSLNFIWVCFSQRGYILGHLREKYTRGQPVILNSAIKPHNLQYGCYVTRCLIRAFKWMYNLLQTSM